MAIGNGGSLLGNSGCLLTGIVAEQYRPVRPFETLKAASLVSVAFFVEVLLTSRGAPS